MAVVIINDVGISSDLQGNACFDLVPSLTNHHKEPGCCIIVWSDLGTMSFCWAYTREQEMKLNKRQVASFQIAALYVEELQFNCAYPFRPHLIGLGECFRSAQCDGLYPLAVTSHFSFPRYHLTIDLPSIDTHCA